MMVRMKLNEFYNYIESNNIFPLYDYSNIKLVLYYIKFSKTIPKRN